MRFGHLEIFSVDPVGSIPFYRDALGFELIEVQGGMYVWLTSGSAVVLLRPGENLAATEDYRHTPIAMVLYTDDLDAAVARLAEHGVEIRGDDGPGCLTLRDPDGHWLQLVENEAR